MTNIGEIDNALREEYQYEAFPGKDKIHRGGFDSEYVNMIDRCGEVIRALTAIQAKHGEIYGTARDVDFAKEHGRISAYIDLLFMRLVTIDGVRQIAKFLDSCESWLAELKNEL